MNGPKQLARGIVHTSDRLLSDIQARVRDIISALRLLPFLRGRLISVSLTASVGTTINHKLGVPAAFFVIRHNYNGAGTTVKITESATSFQTPLDANNQLSVVADTNCLLDLWFYPRASVPVLSGKVQAP